MVRQLVIDPVLSPADARDLRAGDRVVITGRLLTARDAACQRMVNTMAAGGRLPFDLAGRVIYAVGPTPARPGHVIGSAGPTTATRLMPFMDRLLGAGLRGLIGKGDFPPEGAHMFQRYGAVYFAALGGAGATIAKTITAVDVIAYDDLGPEAVHRFTVDGFPAIVAIDTEGNNLHQMARARWRRREP